MKLALLFAVNAVGYTIIYVVYSYAQKTMPDRIVYVAAVVAGTIIGSTLGVMWFK